MEYDTWVEQAHQVKEKAYVPYSKFHVGAVVMDEYGRIFTGVNIENASYGATNCAERTAIFKAVSEGAGKLRLVVIASDLENYIYPCGICRQVIAEFATADTQVICSNSKHEYKVYSMKEILPFAFTEFSKA